jgi:hypothetical protein
VKILSHKNRKEYFMKPLGLPEGSVRALILLALVLAVVFPVFVLVFMRQDIPPTVDKYLTMLAGAVILLIREYIGLRKQQDENKPGEGKE